MKQYTTDTAHPHRHVRRNGTVVYVTTAHRDRLYKRGAMPPNYPVPAANLEVIPLVIDGECIAIDIVNRSNENGPWPVVAMFDKY